MDKNRQTTFVMTVKKITKSSRGSKKGGNRFLRIFNSLDLFGESLTFNIDGQDEHKTTLGAIVSVLMLAAFVLYVGMQASVLLNRGDTKH